MALSTQNVRWQSGHLMRQVKTVRAARDARHTLIAFKSTDLYREIEEKLAGQEGAIEEEEADLVHSFLTRSKAERMGHRKNGHGGKIDEMALRKLSVEWQAEHGKDGHTNRSCTNRTTARSATYTASSTNRSARSANCTARSTNRTARSREGRPPFTSARSIKFEDRTLSALQLRRLIMEDALETERIDRSNHGSCRSKPPSSRKVYKEGGEASRLKKGRGEAQDVPVIRRSSPAKESHVRKGMKGMLEAGVKGGGLKGGGGGGKGAGGKGGRKGGGQTIDEADYEGDFVPDYSMGGGRAAAVAVMGARQWRKKAQESKSAPSPSPSPTPSQTELLAC